MISYFIFYRRKNNNNIDHVDNNHLVSMVYTRIFQFELVSDIIFYFLSHEKNNNVAKNDLVSMVYTLLFQCSECKYIPINHTLIFLRN